MGWNSARRIFFGHLLRSAPLSLDLPFFLRLANFYKHAQPYLATEYNRTVAKEGWELLRKCIKSGRFIDRCEYIQWNWWKNDRIYINIAEAKYPLNEKINEDSSNQKLEKHWRYLMSRDHNKRSSFWTIANVLTLLIDAKFKLTNAQKQR